MKKWFAILLTFSIIYLTKVAPVFAATCDSDLYDSGNITQETQIYVTGNSAEAQCGNDACTQSVLCIPISGPFGLTTCFLTCWQPKPGAHLTKDPTCPPNYTNPTTCMVVDPNFCCKEGNLATCAGHEWDFTSCADLESKVTYSSKKNYCGTYGPTYHYVPDQNLCVRFSEIQWSQNNTTCQGVSGFDTAVGCVPTGDLKLFIAFVLKWVFFASGGIILLLIISTGYTIITSSGNPEKLQGAQENIVALFSGLALIAFSLVLLQAIGADILNLSAFKP